MNKLIGVLLIVGACWGAWSVRNYYLQRQAEDPNMNYGNEPAKPPGFVPQQLAGMHYNLETQLDQATRGGAASLKRFLDQYRPVIKDPRLGWIELDYVVLVAGRDPAQARAVYADVKKRTPTNSPIHWRVEKLAKTYD